MGDARDDRYDRRCAARNVLGQHAPKWTYTAANGVWQALQAECNKHHSTT